MSSSDNSRRTTSSLLAYEKRPEAIRLATLRSVMGKDCLKIFVNLKLTEEESTSVNASLAALEAYFNPKTSVARKVIWNGVKIALLIVNFVTSQCICLVCWKFHFVTLKL